MREAQKEEEKSQESEEIVLCFKNGGVLKGNQSQEKETNELSSLDQMHTDLVHGPSLA